MNLYWKSHFGGIMPTEKFEAKLNRLAEDYQHYLEVEASKELAEYKELYEKVTSADFKEIKRTLVNRKYKDTQEYRDTAKYNKLENKESLKLYFEVLESKELKEYLSFKETEDFRKLSDKKAVKASEELSRFKKFERSKEYKAYNRFHDSYIEKEYLELKEKMKDPEFIKNNKFWSNPNRWETTQEYNIERRYKELCEDEYICFYLSHKKEEFETVDKFRLILEENFAGDSLQKTKWEAGFYYNNPNMIRQHSFANERQSNNCGRNIRISDKKLHIETKEEKNEALAWNKDKGFENIEFDYSSDVINGKNVFFDKYGVFVTKMQFDGSKGVSHAFSLKGVNKIPHINLCKCENGTIEVGVYAEEKGNVKYISNKIKGININNPFLYSLVWNEKELIWYINDYEIFRTTNGIPQEEMYPMLNSYIKENKKGGSADFEVDYIKIYVKK